MKKRIITSSCIAGLLLALAAPVLAADEGKEVTLTGEGKCAKCSLKTADKCQNVIQTTEDGKTVTYYLTKNEVSNDFHDNLCKQSKKITVTGTVKDVDGKKEITASKIELAKD